jgi:hypothetical protein
VVVSVSRIITEMKLKWNTLVHFNELQLRGRFDSVFYQNQFSLLSSWMPYHKGVWEYTSKLNNHISRVEWSRVKLRFPPTYGAYLLGFFWNFGKIRNKPSDGAYFGTIGIRGFLLILGILSVWGQQNYIFFLDFSVCFSAWLG